MAVRGTSLPFGECNYTVVSEHLNNTNLQQTFTISNDGNALLEVIQIHSDDTKAVIVYPQAPLQLHPGESQSISVYANYAELATGASAQQITINAANQPQQTVLINVQHETPIQLGGALLPMPTATPIPTPDADPLLAVNQIQEVEALKEETVWFRFIPQSDGFYLIDTSPVNSRDKVNTVLQVFGPNNKEVRMGHNDDRSRNDFYSSVTQYFEAGNEYFISIHCYGLRQSGHIQLRVLENSSVDPIVNPVVSPVLIDASPIPIEFETGDEVHWFEFAVPEDGAYSIEAKFVQGQKKLDTILHLFHKSELMDWNDDCGKSLHSCITQFMKRGDVYQIKVESYAHSIGHCTIGITKN